MILPPFAGELNGFKGSRSRAIRQQQFEYAYIFGAACPAKDKALNVKPQLLYWIKFWRIRW
jgi:hypothetical protein